MCYTVTVKNNIYGEKMKKTRYLASALALFCAFAFTGCSCSQQTALSFSAEAFGGNAEPRTGYEEVCEYSVEYKADSVLNPRSASLSSDVFDLEYSDGIFTTELKVISPSSIPDYAKSDILDVVTSEENVYSYKTDFSINVSYTVNGEKLETPYNEKITTVSYFCSMKKSYAPIYSATTAKYTTIVAYDSNVQINNFEAEYSISYSQKEYVVKKTTGNTNSTKSYDYIYKTAADNAQLLFLLRNKSIDVDGNATLPVIAPAYGEQTVLYLANKSKETADYRVNDNVTPISFDNVYFSVNDVYTSGISQRVAIGTYEGKKLLIEYEEPLTTYGGMLALGALKYTLKTVR